jgi:hypothetical protein
VHLQFDSQLCAICSVTLHLTGPLLRSHQWLLCSEVVFIILSLIATAWRANTCCLCHKTPLLSENCPKTSGAKIPSEPGSGQPAWIGRAAWEPAEKPCGHSGPGCADPGKLWLWPSLSDVSHGKDMAWCWSSIHAATVLTFLESLNQSFPTRAPCECSPEIRTTQRLGPARSEHASACRTAPASF